MEYNTDEFEDLLGLEDEPTPPTPDDDDDNPDPTPDPEPDTDEDDEPDEAAQSYFEILKDNELLNLPEDFEFDATPKKLKEALDITRERNKLEVRNEFESKIKPGLRPLLEYALAGGESVEDFISAYSTPDYTKFNLDDEEDQRAILFEYYRLTSNYTDEKINKIIDRFQADDLRQEAEETVGELQELADERKQRLIEETKAQEELRKQQVLEQTTKLTDAIEKSNAFDAARKNRLKTFMFVPINDGTTNSTQLAKTMQQITTNPEHLVQLADILADYNPKTGLSQERIKKQLKAQSNISFKEYLHSKVDPKSQVKNGRQQKIAENIDWDTYFNN